MLDEVLLARIPKSSGQSASDAQPVVDLTQERRAAVAAQVSAAEIHHDFSITQVLKKHRVVQTVCRRCGGGISKLILLHNKSLQKIAAAFQSWV